MTGIFMEKTALLTLPKAAIKMSNSNKVGVFAQIKSLFSNKAKAAVLAPVTVVQYVEPSEDEQLKAYLTKEDTAGLAADSSYVESLEDESKAATKEAKIAAAKAKLKADSAARVAKAEISLSNALAKAEVAVLTDLVATQEMAERVASYDAKRDLIKARMDAIRNGRVHDMSIVEAHLSADDSRAEQARQAAILLAKGRNTAAPKGGKSYTSNAAGAGTGKGNESKDNGEKPESRRAIAFKALKSAGLSKELANEVLDYTYDNKVDAYVQKLQAEGKLDFLNKVAAIMMGENGSYAPRWERALAANASSSAAATSNGQGVDDEDDDADKASPDSDTPAKKTGASNIALPKRA